tara:strand:+ start:3711 stop:3965 length:255 start_codon:yes stop_codon:yes gene_type:complete
MKADKIMYYYEIEVSYKKGKSTHKSQNWLISRYEKPGEIMHYDHRAMRSLESRLYSKNYKGQKKVLIRKVLKRLDLGPISSQIE